jgi:hypothetical protein
MDKTGKEGESQMKARKLRELLGDPGYIISQDKDFICIGNDYVHDLISVDKKTLKVKYALDTFHKGRESLGNEVLQSIWDTLHHLIETGEIREIIGGKDIIKNPLPVFTVRDGELVESVTDEYGWPNTDDDGILMYNNTHFSTQEKALKYGIREYSARVKTLGNTIGELEKKVRGFKQMRQDYRSKIKALKELRNECE